MVFEGACEGKSHVNYSVAYERQKVVLEVLIEQVLRLVHDIFTHEDIELAALECGFITFAEIVSDNFNDCLLLLKILGEFI